MTPATKVDVFGPGLPKSWVVIGARYGKRRGFKLSWTYRLKQFLRKTLHLREPWKQKRSTPGKYPAGSWRWILFDRHVSVRWAGQTPPGIQPGTVAHYSLVSWDHVILMKFPKIWRWFFHHTHVKYRHCDCTHKLWSRRPAGTFSNCPEHGLQRLIDELKAEQETSDKYVEVDVHRYRG